MTFIPFKLYKGQKSWKLILRKLSDMKIFVLMLYCNSENLKDKSIEILADYHVIMVY